MTLGWDAPAEAQLLGTQLRPGILLRIGTPEIARLWAGVGDLEIADDLVETTDGARYRGSGQLVGIPAVNQLINGTSERVEFALTATGITGEIADLASSSAADIRGAVCNLGFLVFDSDWRILSPTAWLWEGVADLLKVEKDGARAPPIRTLKISIGSVMSGRRRPQSSWWTDPDQKRRSADDDFFDQVSRYSVGTTMVWPR